MFADYKQITLKIADMKKKLCAAMLALLVACPSFHAQTLQHIVSFSYLQFLRLFVYNPQT